MRSPSPTLSVVGLLALFTALSPCVAGEKPPQPSEAQTPGSAAAYLRLPIVTLDSGRGAREPVSAVPLPASLRLRRELLHPDSLRLRISEGALLLDEEDRNAKDTLELPPMRATSASEFKAYWKQVEKAEGYTAFRKQMEAGGNIDKSWVPKAYYMDSSVVVIPGYLFIRFPAW